jgi:uncharacterized membrane protein HdeD (DUF308 family)
MANETKNVLNQMLSDIWWLVLLRAIAAILLGILLFANPGALLMVIMIYIGVYWLIDGIFTVIASLRGRKNLEHWGWGIFTGIISILAGLVVLSQPVLSALLTTTFFAYLVGFLAIVSGISSLVSGFRLHQASGEWSMIIGGLMSLLFGLLLVFNPLFSSFVLLSMAGIFALIGGIILLLFAIRMRSAVKAGTHAPVE